MTRNTTGRAAADARYAAARKAVESLPKTADEQERDAAFAELREARRHVSRFAREAGNAALKSEVA